MIRTRMIFSAFLTAGLLLGCDSGGTFEQARSAGGGDSPTVDDECPEATDVNTVANAIPNAVTTSQTCKMHIWNHKERHLCRAHYHFRRASTLNPVLAGSSSDRLKQYYRAILALSRVLGERSLQADGTFMDEPLLLDVPAGEFQTGYDVCGSTPFPVEPLIYFRGLRKEGLELYKTIAEHFVYAMSAEADWQRGISGDTRTFSANVWGDDFEAFLGIRGAWRGKALGFLAGLDTVDLHRLLETNPNKPVSLFTYCGAGEIDDSSGFRFARPECQTRYVVNLPGCSVDNRSERIQRGTKLLRQYGVLGTESGFSEDGDALGFYLAHEINDERIELGQGALGDTDSVLAYHGTDRGSVGEAARYLDDERQVYLYDLEPGEFNGTPVRKGLVARHDHQRLMALARINSSRLWEDDKTQFEVTSCGDVVQYPWDCPLAYPDHPVTATDNYLRHSYFKVLTHLRERLRATNASPWWATEHNVDGYNVERLAEVNQSMIRLVDEEIGAEVVRWDFSFDDVTFALLPWYNPTHTALVFGYGVTVSVPASMSAGGRLRVISGQPLESDGRFYYLKATDESALDGLKCATFGKVRGGPCDLANYEIPPKDSPVCPSGMTCVELDIPFVNGLLPISPMSDDFRPATTYPLFLMQGDRILDAMIVNYGSAWVDSRAYEYTRTVRNVVSETAMERVDRIISRDARQCSEPTFNSLGLRNDLVPPQKTELQVGQSTTPFEDSYRYYLDKARDGALRASQKIAEVNQLEAQQVRLQTELDDRRATALNRVEQICGAGRSSCSTSKGTYSLGELGLLQKGWPYLPSSGPCEDAQPKVHDQDSLGRFMGWLICKGSSLKETAEDFVLVDLPDIIAQSPGDARPLQQSFAGEYLSALLDVSNGIVELANAFERLVISVISAHGTASVLASKMRAEDHQKTAAFWRRLGKAVAGIADAFSAAMKGGGGGGGAAMTFASMANTVIDLAGTVEEEEAREELADAETTSLLLKARSHSSEAEQAFYSIRAQASRIQQGIQRVKALELEQEQQAGNVARAELGALRNLLGGNPEAGEEELAMKSYRKYLTIKHQDAYGALRRAQRMSFIARRALELKLGVDLTREKSAGIIVDAPYKWVDSVYRVYDADGIFNSGGQSDYVTNLEDYLYGYPFDHPFADGDDLAIISLSDDLMDVRWSYQCEHVEGVSNYAKNSEQIDRWHQWLTDGVQILTEAAPSPVDPTQVTAELVLPSMEPWAFSMTTEPAPYHGDSFTMNGSVYLAASSADLQVRLGVIADYHDAGTGQLLRSEIFVVLPGEEIPVSPAQGWVRLQIQGGFSPPEPSEVMKVRLGVESQGGPAYVFGGQITSGAELQPYQRNPAVDPGCQLHQWLDPVSQGLKSIYFPRPEVMQAKMRGRFYVKCAQNEHLIPAYDWAECGSSADVEYFETDFALTLGGIRDGRVLRQQQFAIGNYNFRISDLAVNLVGSNVKDCTLDPGAGTACWQNLFIPYDLSHGGAVAVTDYEAKDHEFRLPTGHIHYGKGLAAERLLTNPPSATDTTVIQPYIKSEFRGRPIQGNYTLRIYNVPGLRWENIEDVQIYLRYRYWSAFSNP